MHLIASNFTLKQNKFDINYMFCIITSLIQDFFKIRSWWWSKPHRINKVGVNFTLFEDILGRTIFIYILAWKPSAAQLLLKVKTAVYPHLNDFTGKQNFRSLSRPTQLGLSNPRWEHSCGSTKFPNQNLRQTVKGFLQTEITTLYMYRRSF